jgi:hypothetical protein
MSADATCAICGRTILAGERVHGFADAGHEHTVCELCVARAERLGWQAAGEPAVEREPGTGHERRGRLRGLLHRGRGPAAGSVGDSVAPADTPPAGLPEADPAAPPPRSRPVPSLDASAPSPTQRAIYRFNASEAGRTVTGLVRTLGMPWVSVGALAGSPEEIRITVAWELSWYQWGVDIGDELRPVFQLDKGQEIDQLDRAARQWNASAAADGRISLGRGAARPAAGEPTAS